MQRIILKLGSGGCSRTSRHVSSACVCMDARFRTAARKSGRSEDEEDDEQPEGQNEAMRHRGGGWQQEARRIEAQATTRRLALPARLASVSGDNATVFAGVEATDGESPGAKGLPWHPVLPTLFSLPNKSNKNALTQPTCPPVTIPPPNPVSLKPVLCEPRVSRVRYGSGSGGGEGRED